MNELTTVPPDQWIHFRCRCGQPYEQFIHLVEHHEEKHCPPAIQEYAAQRFVVVKMGEKEGVLLKSA